MNENELQSEVERLHALAAKSANHLRLIAQDVRSAGDIPLVFMNEDGAGRIEATLADELWLIAYNLEESQ